MLENLTKKFSSIIKGIRGETQITEKNSAEILAELRYALLEADVALPVVKNFNNKPFGYSDLKTSFFLISSFKDSIPVSCFGKIILSGFIYS